MNDRQRTVRVLIVILALFSLVIVRLLYMQVICGDFYEKKSLEQRNRIIDLAAQRGDVFDRNGDILATSIDSYSVYLYKHGWLARKIPRAEAEKFKQKAPGSIAVLKEKKRVYPKGALAAQTLGFVGADNQGLSGIELAFDEYLKGKNGRVVTEGDPGGMELYGALRELEPGMDGMNLTLTIDGNIQYIAEREIKRAVRDFRARSGMCIVMDIKSGEILALASKPDFDPNAYQKSPREYWHPKILDPYEPGSTFKVITAAAGLQAGAIAPDTRLSALDSITLGGKVIENSHKIKWTGPQITLSEMLEQSINTGSAQIGVKLGPERFYEKITAFGFGERTGFGLWGESPGIFRHWTRWYKPDVGMISFGQGIAVTPLQLLCAVAAIGNNGALVKPLLLKKIESPDGKFIKVSSQYVEKRAVSVKVAEEVKKLMRSVVLKGTGKKAQMPYFAVCGKTGTAQKAIPNGIGYLKGNYIASFIGFAPMKDPRIAALVIVDDPQGSYWGETVCAPVFKSVVEYALRYLNVKPDML